MSPSLRHPLPRPADGAAGERPRSRVVISNLGELLLPPRWLSNLGRSAWLIVGIALVAIASVWVLALTQTIVMPVLAAAVIAPVASPIVAWLTRHRVGRGLGAALVLVAITLLAVGLVVMVVGGILSQTGAVSRELDAAKGTLTGWFHDLGVSQAQAEQAKTDVSQAISDARSALLG